MRVAYGPAGYVKLPGASSAIDGGTAWAFEGRMQGWLLPYQQLPPHQCSTAASAEACPSISKAQWQGWIPHHQIVTPTPFHGTLPAGRGTPKLLAGGLLLVSLSLVAQLAAVQGACMPPCKWPAASSCFCSSAHQQQPRLATHSLVSCL